MPTGQVLTDGLRETRQWSFCRRVYTSAVILHTVRSTHFSYLLSQWRIHLDWGGRSAPPVGVDGSKFFTALFVDTHNMSPIRCPMPSGTLEMHCARISVVWIWGTARKLLPFASPQPLYLDLSLHSLHLWFALAYVTIHVICIYIVFFQIMYVWTLYCYMFRLCRIAICIIKYSRSNFV